ncbi:Hypothetical predicted protein [Olea europaea subsp. europaea]|uniref:Uncharacterized protein n=2 Tax=Olea europaea subsp. europaea TaxID=158383 RepID=A0A8S0SXT6_OLEEU|nr:Hypothetical predicted protein [Olea europaea subsp. europaea]
MASGMLPFRPAAVVRASISADDQKPEAKKTPSSHWWAPLFGLSSDPDYIQSDEKKSNPDPRQSKSRFTPGSFTEEKAKQLRRMTTDTSSFHDMYHSAIASRLASDFADDRRTPFSKDFKFKSIQKWQILWAQNAKSRCI